MKIEFELNMKVSLYGSIEAAAKAYARKYPVVVGVLNALVTRPLWIQLQDRVYPLTLGLATLESEWSETEFHQALKDRRYRLAGVNEGVCVLGGTTGRKGDDPQHLPPRCVSG